MTFSIINPDSLGMPRGYSNGVLASEGKMLFVAGQVGWNSQQQIVGEDFVDQFSQALDNVITVVREAGGLPQNIAQLTIFVTSRSEYLASLKRLGVAYRKRMAGHFPAMALVEVSGLVEAAAKVEIQAIAVI